MENPKLTEFTTFKLSMNVLTIFSRYDSISFRLFQRVIMSPGDSHSLHQVYTNTVKFNAQYHWSSESHSMPILSFWILLPINYYRIILQHKHSFGRAKLVFIFKAVNVQGTAG